MKKKFKKLKPNNIIKIGDYVSLNLEFDPFQLKIDAVCAWNGWVKLSKKSSNGVGNKVSETPYTVARPL